MSEIAAYILRVLSACIICAVVLQVLNPGTASAKIIRVVCGVFISITLLSPIINVDLRNFAGYFDKMEYETKQIVESGVTAAEESRCNIIIEKTEAYIEDEAKRFDLVLDVEVSLGKTYPQVPESVKIYGDASPYQKQMIILYIENELGILRENVQWI